MVVEDVDKEPRLSELSTQWTMLFQANHGTPEEASDALRLMMLRYSGAVHRYLLKTVDDSEEVKELDQEFALRFLKGSFLKYNPSFGRFRDYVKGAVRNLMIDYYRRKGKCANWTPRWKWRSSAHRGWRIWTSRLSMPGVMICWIAPGTRSLISSNVQASLTTLF